MPLTQEFVSISDPRSTRHKRHDLSELLTVAVCAVLKGKVRKSNGLSGSMSDAGCSGQLPISVRHVSRLTERRPKWHRKHCLPHPAYQAMR